MWVSFLRDFDWTPPERRTVTLAFRLGATVFVRYRCGVDAIAAGAAIPAARPARERGHV